MFCNTYEIYFDLKVKMSLLLKYMIQLYKLTSFAMKDDPVGSPHQR